MFEGKFLTDEGFFLYGNLNKEVEKVAYKGGETPSAKVHIDYDTNTIYVNTSAGEVDDTLLNNSTNPVQNKVLFDKFTQVESNLTDTRQFTEVNVGELRRRLVDYYQELLDMDKRIKDLSIQISEKEDDHDVDIIALNDTVKQLDDVVKSLKNDIDSIEVTFRQQLNTVNKSLIQQYDKLSQVDVTLTTEIQRLDGLIKDVVTMIENTNHESHVTIQEFNKQLSAINDRVNTLDVGLSEQIIQLNNSYDNLYITSGELEQQIKELKEVNLGLVTKEALAEEVSSLQEADQFILDLFNDRTTELNQRIQTLDEQVTKDTTSINKELGTLKTKASDIEKQLSQMGDISSSNISDLQTQLTNETNERITQDSNIRTLVGNVENSLKASITNLETKLSDNSTLHNRDISELRSTINGLSQEVSTNSSSIDSIQEDISELNTQVKDLTDTKVDSTTFGSLVQDVTRIDDTLSTFANKTTTESSISYLTDRIDSLNTRHDTEVGDVTTRFNQHVIDNKTQIESIDSELTNLRSIVSNNYNELREDTDNLISTVETNRVNNESENDYQNTRLVNLESTKKQHTETLSDHEERLITVEEDLAAVTLLADSTSKTVTNLSEGLQDYVQNQISDYLKTIKFIDGGTVSTLLNSI